MTALALASPLVFSVIGAWQIIVALCIIGLAVVLLHFFGPIGLVVLLLIILVLLI